MIIYLLQVTFVIRSENEERNEVCEIVYSRTCLLISTLSIICAV